MQLSLSFVLSAIAAASTLTLASPIQEQAHEIQLGRRDTTLTKADSTEVDFVKVKNHISQIQAKYQKTLSNYETNMGHPHPDADSSVKSKRATSTISLTDQQDETLWSGPSSWGGQSIMFDYDTGSSDTIADKGAYTPGSSARDTGTTFTDSYGDGSTASGEVYTDTVKAGSVSAKGCAIGLASTSDFITGGGTNGLSGMAYPALASFDSPYNVPYFDCLYKSGALSNNVFTFKLRAGSGSSLTLGAVATSNTPSYVSVSRQAYWQVPASVNGQSISSIVDTGTTLIVAPTSAAQTFFNNLGVQTFTQDGALYGYYNCNSPPKVTFKYGSFSRTLSAATTSFGTASDGSCVLSVVGQDVGLNAWVTGDSFLQNVVAVFDRANNRVGFSTS